MSKPAKLPATEKTRCPFRDAWCTRDRCMFADEDGTPRCVREEEEERAETEPAEPVRE